MYSPTLNSTTFTTRTCTGRMSHSFSVVTHVPAHVRADSGNFDRRYLEIVVIAVGAASAQLTAQLAKEREQTGALKTRLASRRGSEAP